jgi:rhodanese-related sulfurtransferase
MSTIRSTGSVRAAAGIAAWTAAWLVACGASNAGGTPSVSPDEVLALREQTAAPLLLDVRTPQEFQGGHVPGAVNIPHSELTARLGEIEAARESGVVVYCESGRRAAAAADVLLGAGFEDVRHLEGDMSGWRAAGLPVER